MDTNSRIKQLELMDKVCGDLLDAYAEGSTIPIHEKLGDLMQQAGEVRLEMLNNLYFELEKMDRFDLYPNIKVLCEVMN